MIYVNRFWNDSLQENLSFWFPSRPSGSDVCPSQVFEECSIIYKSHTRHTSLLLHLVFLFGFFLIIFTL